MDYTPISDRILVKPVSAEIKTGGLIIPDTSSNLKKGIVVSVGDGKDGRAISVSVEQVVYYKNGVGEKVILDGESYLLFYERDIWLKSKEDGEKKFY